MVNELHLMLPCHSTVPKRHFPSQSLTHTFLGGYFRLTVLKEITLICSDFKRDPSQMQFVSKFIFSVNIFYKSEFLPASPSQNATHSGSSFQIFMLLE